MKIGVNSRIYQNHNTGIPYYVESLYKKLLESDKKNSYVFFQTAKNKTIGNTKIISLNNSNHNAVLFDNFLVNRLITKEEITVYHGPASILPFFKKKGIRYVVTIHDLSFLYFTNNQSKLFNIYYKYFIGRSLKNADVIVADSENTKKDILKYYNVSSEKIKVVYLGVNEIYLKQKKTKRLIETPYFLTLSTHPKRKNIYRIIEILAKEPKLKHITFVIAGLIPEEQVTQLQTLIASLKLEKRVIIYGYASEQDLISLYQHAEFFIYPSYYEGFGFPIVEAMMSRCPVIASNTSSVPEITPSSKWLVDPYDSEEIAQVMSNMLELTKTQRDNLITENFNFARQFTWERASKAMLTLFNT